MTQKQKLNAFEAELITNLIAGINEYTDRMVDRMRRKAPIGKTRSTAKGAAAFRVRPQSMDARARPKYTPKDQADEEAQKAILSFYQSGGRRKLTRATRMQLASNPRQATLLAGRYVYTEGPNKGESPAKIRIERGSVKGVGRQPGRLRKSIHSIPATLEGMSVVGGVAVDAPYAKYVEYGFIHKGAASRYVKSQPFFRPVWKDNQAAGAARLARYVKRAGQ